MPNRIIKESINESRALAECSPFAQDLFKRLITYSDDYGRFNADFSIMRARLFPLEIDEVCIEVIEEAIVELIGAGKVSLYRELRSGEPTGKVFGYLPGWFDHQRKRDNKSKFPDPKEEWNDWALQRCVPIALKIEIFERDNFTCRACGHSYRLKGFTTRQAIRILSSVIHIDHTVPVGQGGRATSENLRLLCAVCHRGRSKRIDLEDMRQLAAGGGKARRVDAKSVKVVKSSEMKAETIASAALFNAEFWPHYPTRKGKKVEKDETCKRFIKLSPDDQLLCCKAVKNYAASEQVQAGIGIRDPKRFIYNDSGEFWRDWITPETATTNGKAVVCVWPVQQEGSYRKRDCREPIAGLDVNPKQRPFCAKCLPLRRALDRQMSPEKEPA